MVKKIALVGVVVGDEGKAKAESYIINLALNEVRWEEVRHWCKPVMTERWQGGGNAGHTLVIDGEEYKLNQTPSGILFVETYNLMGQKMYIDPRRLVTEIKMLRKRKIPISPANLGIASNAHITLDYHTQADRALLEIENHTSTGSGIKQTAIDKQGRTGLRFAEFLDAELMQEILEKVRFKEDWPYTESIADFVASYNEEREFLKEFVILQTRARREQGSQFWIGEGAQGAMLDVDIGLYPGTTSSNPIEAPNRPDLILGVMKLYTSSVGKNRPFVSQMPHDLEEPVREAWKEFGTKTGKPRDVGWVDIVALRYAIECGQVDYLIGNCGDRLSFLAEMGRDVELVVAYTVDGCQYEEWDELFHCRDKLFRAIPIKERFKPWESFTEEDGQTLTPNAERYVRRIEELVGKSFIMLGNGPGQDQMIMYNNPFKLIKEKEN